jgi:glutaredoxin
MLDKYNKKIQTYNNQDIYIIFYSPWCQYSKSAIQLLEDENKSFKGYDIDNFNGGLDTLLYYLNLNKELTNFNPSHKTRPIIFYKGKFIGGFSELSTLFNNNYKLANYHP